MLEVFICAIHPIPGHFLVEWSSQYVKKAGTNSNFINPYRSSQNTGSASTLLNSTTTTEIPTTTTITLKDTQELPQAYVPIDVMLSLPSKHKKCFVFFENLFI
jgi:hypothetical protein